MSWFVFGLICVLGWGLADIFYKKGSDENDRYSHLKIAVWVGIVMGAVSAMLLLIFKNDKTISDIVHDAVCYAPASISYIISMIIGYAGLRYLELSIVSPVQNASGAFSMLCMLAYFLIRGKTSDISEYFSALDLVGTILIITCMIALAIVEQNLSGKEKTLGKDERKYKYGAAALIFPILYCIFDTVGTAADGIILDESVGLGLGEIDVLILYGLTFFLAGLIAFIVLWIVQKRPYNVFAKKEGIKAAAACCEEFGQVFYVFAMARNPVLAAPMVASYCVISVILSRLWLKEKLTVWQCICVIGVIIGILLLGISEGLAS